MTVATLNKTNQYEITNKVLTELPKHVVYVDVFGNGDEVLMNKSRSRLEIFNDMDNSKLHYLLKNRMNKTIESIQYNERWKKVMLECVNYERLLSIYDSSGTLMYADIRDKDNQAEIAAALMQLESKVVVITDDTTLFSEWLCIDDMPIYLNYDHTQLSLF